MEGRTTGLIALYIFGAITMVIAILGAYGAHREKKGALIAVSSLTLDKITQFWKGHREVKL